MDTIPPPCPQFGHVEFEQMCRSCHWLYSPGTKGQAYRAHNGIAWIPETFKATPAQRKEFSLTIIVPTLGRPTLLRTLDSITRQLEPGDEVMVLRDDSDDWGMTPRAGAMMRASGAYLLFLDDDDIYLPGALAIVRRALQQAPGRPHLFAMRRGATFYDQLPHEQIVKVGNVGTQMICVPNDPQHLGTWTRCYAGDYDFLASTLALYPPEALVWHNDVISVWRPDTIRWESDKQEDNRDPLNATTGLLEMLADVIKTNGGPLAHVAEVGCHHGVSTACLAGAANVVYAVDPWPEEQHFWAFYHVAGRLPNVKIVRLTSPLAARAFEDHSLDLVYIDGDHKYNAVLADIDAWWPKLRPGGWMTGHDFSEEGHPDIVRAVTERLGKPQQVYADHSWLVRIPLPAPVPLPRQPADHNLTETAPPCPQFSHTTFDSSCRSCYWLYDTTVRGLAYREHFKIVWNPPNAVLRPPPSKPLELACISLRDPTGKEIQCPGCQGNTRIKTFACDKYSVCTTHLSLDSIACCITCPDNQPRFRKHLLYHIYPRHGRDWLWNIDQLRHRLALFDGQKIVAIVTDRSTVAASMVKDRLIDTGCEFLELPNNPDRREVTTFLPLFERLAHLTDKEDVTLWAHAKGVTNKTWVDGGATIQLWTQTLYETLLDYWPAVSQILRRFPLAGSFRRLGRYWPQTESTSIWHYAGSWFWFRNADLFTKDWRRIEQKWFGIETYPSKHFDPKDAGVVFADLTTMDGSWPYRPEVWKQTLLPLLEKWRSDHVRYKMSLQETKG